MRKPFIGVQNVMRFNWPMYGLAGASIVILITAYILTRNTYLIAAAATLFLPVLISLFVSWYIYDRSNLYTFDWLDSDTLVHGNVVNIHAGFDETSEILIRKFPLISLHVLDFYDPVKHTEPSIRRARRLYPAFPGTKKTQTTQLPFDDNYADTVLILFSAHEIRDAEERKLFFKEINRIAKPSAKIIVTEHMRDWKNFIAYTIGFLHFVSRSSWRAVFAKTSIHLEKEIAVTPFITTFICSKNGTTS